MLALGSCGGSAPEAARIDDPAFVAAAGRICSERLPELRADISDDAAKEPSEVAPVVADRARELSALVRDLRAIEVTSGARTAVSDWFSDWDDYVGVGERYADALESGEPATYSAVAAEGEGPQARISAFARANKFEACALDGVPLPERESPI